MPSNRGVVYLGPGKVEVQTIDYPKFVNPAGKPINHGFILKVVATNICGSDQHMVRGHTTAPVGMIFGHEVAGEIIEVGSDVEYHKIGDLVSVPFNVACGRCRNCREQHTSLCLNITPERAGGAYGYVDMGGWIGGQAEYFMVPYADFNLLKFPDKAQALQKMRDLTCITDILPTGFHGAVHVRVGVGSTDYIAGAGPVGLAAAASARILGAAAVYRKPPEVSAEDLAIMALLDRHYLARPYLWLAPDGGVVGDSRPCRQSQTVQRLMRLLGLVAIYQRPNTSKPAAAHKVYPYRLGGIAIERVN